MLMAKKRSDEGASTAGIERRLDAIIHILLRQTEVQEMSTRKQIEVLDRLGLRDSEIAGILGRTRGYVAGELSVVRRGSRAK